MQHNFLLVHPIGRPMTFPLDPKKKDAAILDPWRTISPRVYFTNPSGYWYEIPTNTGIE